MIRRIWLRGLTVLLVGTLWAAAGVEAQTTWYVDDDAPGDPGPGDPMVSDPLEDGSAEHPFDGIQEAIFVSQDGDTVLVLDGTYTGLLNKNLDFGGLAIIVRAENGPDNCIIDCQADGRGFQFRYGETPTSVLDGVTIRAGHVIGDFDDGGAIYCYQSSPTITNCVIAANSAAGDGGGLYCYDGNPRILDCIFVDNVPGAIWCDSTDVLISGCIVANNDRHGIALWHGSPTVTRCFVAANGRAGVVCAYSSPSLSNCMVVGNQAGGVEFYNDVGAGTIADCTIVNNYSPYAGAGIKCEYSSDAMFINCTVAANTSSTYGGGIQCFSATAMLVNCVLWGDEATEGGPEIALRGTSEMSVSYSDVEGGWAWAYVSGGCILDWQEGNMVADPVFIDPDGPDNDANTWEDNNFHLDGGSPCIDAGDAEFVPEPDERDIDEQMRVWDGDEDGEWRVDMGSDEFASRCPGDLDGDADADLGDLAVLLANYGMTSGAGWEDGDLDLDGDVDLGDLAALLAVYGTNCD